MRTRPVRRVEHHPERGYDRLAGGGAVRGCLALVAALDDLRHEGGQVLVATHSPLVAALPGATVLELGEHGLRQVAYDALDLVRDWRAYLDAPERYLRHPLGGG